MPHFRAAFSIASPAFFTSLPTPSKVLQAARTVIATSNVRILFMLSFLKTTLATLAHQTHINEVPRNPRCRSHRRRNQMRAPTLPLATFKISV